MCVVTNNSLFHNGGPHIDTSTWALQLSSSARLLKVFPLLPQCTSSADARQSWFFEGDLRVHP